MRTTSEPLDGAALGAGLELDAACATAAPTATIATTAATSRTRRARREGFSGMDGSFGRRTGHAPRGAAGEMAVVVRGDASLA